MEIWEVIWALPFQGINSAHRKLFNNKCKLCENELSVVTWALKIDQNLAHHWKNMDWIFRLELSRIHLDAGKQHDCQLGILIHVSCALWWTILEFKSWQEHKCRLCIQPTGEFGHVACGWMLHTGLRPQICPHPWIGDCYETLLNLPASWKNWWVWSSFVSSLGLGIRRKYAVGLVRPHCVLIRIWLGR